MSQTPEKKRQSKPGTRAKGFQIPANKKVGSGGGVSKPQKMATKTEPQPATTPVQTNQRNAPPMKKRAKGSGFLAFLFMSAFAFAGYYVWISLLQYQSYGVVEGRRIAVASPWNGTVKSWLVREGDVVQQGDVLVTISNLDMEHELASLQDELKMNQALLDAEISKIKFEVQDQTERNQKAVAEYLKSYGELLAEKTRLQELDRQYERTKKLVATNNIARSEFEKIYYQLSGQRRKIDKLEDAVEILKIRSHETNLNQDNGQQRLKPILAQIELNRSKIERLRERINQGNLRAPISGRVSKRHCLTGEASPGGEPIVDLLEDNSVEAVLYVPQKIVDEFEIGAEVQIDIEPYDRPVACVVDRIGDRFGPAPTSIERFYRFNEALMPVYLVPRDSQAEILSNRIGSTIKRPYEYRKGLSRLLSEFHQFTRSLDSKSESPVTVDSNRKIKPQIPAAHSPASPSTVDVHVPSKIANSSLPPASRVSYGVSE